MHDETSTPWRAIFWGDGPRSFDSAWFLDLVRLTGSGGRCKGYLGFALSGALKNAKSSGILRVVDGKFSWGQL